jgi:general secretion pathway protein B
MSLILDALRKSEHQRQRQAGPGLAVVPEGRVTERPANWVIALAGLLVLNVIVVAALWLTGRNPAPAAAVATQAAQTPPAAAALAAPTPAPVASAEVRSQPPRPVTLPHQPARSEVRPLTTEVAPPTSTSAAAPATSAVPSAASAPGASFSPEATARAVTPPPAPAMPSTTQANDDARLPRFADLVVRGDLNVPHMHIDIHVYGGTPAERFVFINMRRYNEDQATQEGPRIVRITRDGVVMDHQGTRFFLSRD